MKNEIILYLTQTIALIEDLFASKATWIRARKKLIFFAWITRQRGSYIHINEFHSYFSYDPEARATLSPKKQELWDNLLIKVRNQIHAQDCPSEPYVPGKTLLTLSKGDIECDCLC